MIMEISKSDIWREGQQAEDPGSFQCYSSSLMDAAGGISSSSRKVSLSV